MCGIIGFIGKTDYNKEKIRFLFYHNQERGKDSTGIWTPVTDNVIKECVKAEEFMKSKKLKCHTVNLHDSQYLAFQVIQATGQRTVPNLFIDGQHIGGHDALIESYEKCMRRGKNQDNHLLPDACAFFKGMKKSQY